MTDILDILPYERSRSSFDVSTLENIITKSNSNTIDQFAPLFDEPIFHHQEEDLLLSYEDRFKTSIARVSRSFQIVRENPEFMVAHMKQKVQMETFFDHNGIFLHFSMFLNYLKSQANKAQLRFWNAEARQGNFIGAYAQTELGHGSNVRGLETLATLDLVNQEYEIHSPTLTSLKFWPTGMYACTHAMVFAQLIIDGSNKGLHGFMVQLRQANGELMPGVELGEIGPKLNFASTNIGYCRFTRVRIPMDRMFSKYSTVTPETGEYIAAPRSLSKFRYISMMLARTSIVRIAYKMCAKATTIAIRYSAVRKQGFKSQATGGGGVVKKEEHAVLDYKMQQYRLFKSLAYSYCLLWNARYIHAYIKGIQNRLEDGDTSAADDLPELHATLSGLKATATVTAHENIEEARKCCGGQGFLLSSGIAKLSADFSEWVTVEGEQVILSLQCARFLLKAVHRAMEQGTLTETVRYIGERKKDAVAPNVSSLNGVLALLKMRARNLAWRCVLLFCCCCCCCSVCMPMRPETDVFSSSSSFCRRFARLTMQFDHHQKTLDSFDDALNQSAVIAVKASTAHVQQFMFENNLKAIRMYFDDNVPVATIMSKLLMLHGLQLISEHVGDLNHKIDSSMLFEIDRQINALMDEIRPDAIALVDAFGFSDEYELRSTIGRKDGNVYEAIMKEIYANPLNNASNNGKMIGWESYSKVLNLSFLDEAAKAQSQRPLVASKM